MDRLIRLVHDGSTSTLRWETEQETLLSLASPVVLETFQDSTPSSSAGDRTVLNYSAIDTTGSETTATAAFSSADGVDGSVTATLNPTTPTAFTISRFVKITSAPENVGIRLGLELRPSFPEGNAFNDFEYYAPNACYNLNDLNEDGVDDYLNTQTLSYREDRLNTLSVLAYHPKRELAFTLSRADRPEYDSWPSRSKGQLSFLQDTDIGSLGFKPNGKGALHDTLLTASYPFVEGDRCNALLVQERVPWGAFRPVKVGDSFSVSYTVRIYHAASAHDALWSLIRQQFEVLKPKPVELERSIDEISRLRLEALVPYYMEDSTGAAGFVTNCHPQDGKQLGNVVQYGFTGLNILNASNLLLSSPLSSQASKSHQKATNVIRFYVDTALKSPFGFTHGLYNMDLSRHDSWWTGLLLPLAYASSGDNLEALMGPLYSHREAIINALKGKEGVYLRCVLEETEALLALYTTLPPSKRSDDWLEVANRFGQFLLSRQEADGSWRRAYDFQGNALTDPGFWFGQTSYQQRSSTATVIPFLLHLASLLTSSQQPQSKPNRDAAALALSYRTAALRAGRFVRTHFIDKAKHNGGIHDSIYALPQLVDHESIHFCCRAMLALYDDATVGGSSYFLTGAIRAAQLSASWILLWDIPLPPASTLASHGFRSTGCSGCDAPGAGYFHPMGVIAVADLVRVSQITGDLLYLDIAALCLAASNQNVGKKWGYAREGMQEEGVLLAPWFLDDPMFGEETGFGGRRKGEGNKTCLPWIGAVTVACGGELRKRFGCADLQVLREGIVSKGDVGNKTVSKGGERDGVKVNRTLVNGVHESY